MNMNRIEEIKKRLLEIENEDDELWNKVQQIQLQREILEKEERTLKQEIRKLEAIEAQSMSADWFLDQHKEMEYMGKADGKTDTCNGKIYANCNKCKIPLELFEGNTGIGGYVIGVCPHCKLEIDFTDCSKW